MQETYLCHYGVQGMKWGIRKRRELKRSYKTARRAFRANRVSPFSTTKSKSFGKNTEAVINKYKKEANNNPYEKELTRMDKEAASLNKKWAGKEGTPEHVKTVSEWKQKYNSLVYKNSEYGKQVATKYIKELNQATLKDLNIPNSKEVSQYMNAKKKTLWDKTYINNYAWFDKLY